MMGTNSEARKRHADTMDWKITDEKARVLAALQRVFPTAEWIEGDALWDALQDEGLL